MAINTTNGCTTVNGWFVEYMELLCYHVSMEAFIFCGTSPRTGRVKKGMTVRTVFEIRKDMSR